MDWFFDFLNLIWVNLPGLICILVGLTLCGVEMFTPGFGVPGVTGIVLLIAGVFLIADSVVATLVIIAVLIVVLAVMLVIILRQVSRGALSRSPIVLSKNLTREDGYMGVEDLSEYEGAEGVTLTMLRPVGEAAFGDKRLQVLAEGGYIEKGVRVRVVRAQGNNLTVRAVAAEVGVEQ